jgi:hypothetical protein
MLVGATVVVLVGVFAAIAQSVVDVRRPIDSRLERSFKAAAPHAASFTTFARSAGCTKTSVDWYDCRLEVRPRRAPGREIVIYRVLRDEDGCWIGAVRSPADAISRFPTLRGCERGRG